MHKRRYYKKNSYDIYKLISKTSFLVRCIFCYLTIDNIDLFKNPLINYIILEIFSLYTLLWGLSYLTNMIIIEKCDIRDSGARAFTYFIIHIVYSVILYGIMIFLSWIKVLPI